MFSLDGYVLDFNNVTNSIYNEKQINPLIVDAILHRLLGYGSGWKKNFWMCV
jgi:hypothetical protein